MAHFPSISIVLFVSLIVYCHAKSHNHKHSRVDKELWREFEEFREWKKSRIEYDRLGYDADQVFKLIEDSNEEEINWKLEDIPPSDKPALVGRYIVNQANWTAVATISRQKEIMSFPFANVVAVSDGLPGNGSGIPYMYLTPFDFTGKDIDIDPRATLLMTLAEGPYCQEHQMDPIDPRCARIILSGKIKKIPLTSVEHEIAKNAVFGRHPALIHMPADHKFYFAKLKIGFIAVLDTFGGAKFISVNDYLHPVALSSKSFKTHYVHDESQGYDVYQV